MACCKRIIASSWYAPTQRAGSVTCPARRRNTRSLRSTDTRQADGRWCRPGTGCQPRVQHNLSQISVSQRWGAVQLLQPQSKVLNRDQNRGISRQGVRRHTSFSASRRCSERALGLRRPEFAKIVIQVGANGGRDGLCRANKRVIRNRRVRVGVGIQSTKIIDEYFRHFFWHVIERAPVDCPAQRALNEQRHQQRGDRCFAQLTAVRHRTVKLRATSARGLPHPTSSLKTCPTRLSLLGAADRRP
jgi:hypothetical protein